MKAELFFDRGIGQVSLEDPQVHLYFDQLRIDRKTAEVSAELRVYGGSNGSFGRVHRTRLNLTSMRGRADAARYLETRLTGIDWPAFLEVGLDIEGHQGRLSSRGGSLRQSP